MFENYTRYTVAMRKKLWILGLCLIVLSGCKADVNRESNALVANEKGEESDLWLDENKPIELDSITDWSKFSFSTFAVSLPRDFRVQTLSQEQTEVELVNFVNKEFNSTFDQREDGGRFKLAVAIEPTDENLVDVIDNSEKLEKKVGGHEAFRIELDENGSVVLVYNRAQEQVYYFNFGFDFVNHPEFEELVLENIMFHQRSRIGMR